MQFGHVLKTDELYGQNCQKSLNQSGLTLITSVIGYGHYATTVFPMSNYAY